MKLCALLLSFFCSQGTERSLIQAVRHIGYVFGEITGKKNGIKSTKTTWNIKTEQRNPKVPEVKWPKALCVALRLPFLMSWRMLQAFSFSTTSAPHSYKAEIRAATRISPIRCYGRAEHRKVIFIFLTHFSPALLKKPPHPRPFLSSTSI